MRGRWTGVAELMFGIWTLAAVPVKAIDLEHVRVMKQEARAALKEIQVAGATAKADKAVLVRCDKGESVQAALDKNPGPVTIEIKGICAENVRIEQRSDVVLRGVSGNAALDGLRGVVAEPPRGAALEIRYSPRIGVENLSFNEGPAAGVMLRYSSLTITGCTTNDNALAGIVATFENLVQAYRLESSRNGNSGLVAAYGGYFRCRSCDFVDNARWGAEVSGNTFVTLWSTVMDGSRGLSADTGGYVDVDCGWWTPTDHECRLSAGTVALHTTWGGAVGYGPGNLTGRIDAGDGSVSLFGVQQEDLPEGVLNSLTGQASLETSGSADNQGGEWTSSLAATELRQFARAIFHEGTEFPSPITCFDAADAVVDGSVDPGGMVVDCPHLPVPEE